jgi:hypothetical protein
MNSRKLKMTIPGFTAGSSLRPSVGVHPVVDISAAFGKAGKDVVPQQRGACLLACQLAWNACIGGCSWWEWALGSCVPKCRLLWVGCVVRC